MQSSNSTPSGEADPAGLPAEASTVQARTGIRTAAAITAAHLTSDAAAAARFERVTAGHVADGLVAEQAAQEAEATRSRADAAAVRVRQAAEVAAAAVAEENAAVAVCVARLVEMTADLVDATRPSLDRAIQAEVAATAAALEVRALAPAAMDEHLFRRARTT